MAIDLTGAEERKARAAGIQPVQPTQPEESKPSGKLTFEDLKKDPSVMPTIRRYYQDRYGTDYLDKDEALEDFLSEYRGIQNNTFNTLTFANYASEIEDPEYKAQLGQLYNTFDNELENFADVEGVGSGLMAAGEILAYNIFDPINLLGFGAGKAIASTAGRGAIKGLMGRVFETAAKRPVLAGAVSGAAVEGPTGAATEYAVQKAEKDLDVRDETDWGQVGLAGGISGLTGGAIGALGGKLGKRSAEETNRWLAEADRSSTQGSLAAFDDLEKAVMAPPTVRGTTKPIDPVKDIANTYVIAKEAADVVPEGYDKLGRVLSLDETKKTAVVQYLPEGTKVERKAQYRKDMFDKGAINVEVPLSNLQSPKLETARKMANQYIKDYGTFLDPKEIEEGKKFLKQLDPNIPNEKLDLMLSPAQIIKLRDTANRYVLTEMPNTPLFAVKNLDPRLKETERYAQIIDMLPPEKLDDFKQFLSDNGIKREDLGKIYRSDISVAGAKIQTQAPGAINELIAFGQTVDTADAAARQELDSYLRKIYEIDKTEGQAPGFFSTFVDIWRAALVSQPVTMVRNVQGTATRLPEEVFRSALDNSLINWERELLGLKPIDATDALTTNPLKVLQNFASPEEVVRMARYTAMMNEEVDFRMFQVMDDLIPNELRSVKGLETAAKAVTVANTLNRAQDRWFKSAAFLTELERQYVRAVNLDRIKAPVVTLPDGTAKKLTNIRDVISYQRFDLLTDEMYREAVSFALDMSFQNRQAGSKMFIGGKFFQELQDSLSNFFDKNALARTQVPFFNYAFSNFVYMTNRVFLPGGLIKWGLSYTKVQKLLKEGAEAGRTVQNQIALERETLRLKEGIVEFAGGVSLYAAAGTIYWAMGGDKAMTIRVGDQEYDLRTVAPLNGFLLMIDSINRWVTGQKQRDSFFTDAPEIIAGLSTRRGASASLVGDYLEAMLDNNPDRAEEAAKGFFEMIGTSVGGFVGGLAVPLRPVDEALKTFGVTEREFIDRRLQQVLLPEALLPEDPTLRKSIEGFFNGMIKESVKGSFLEGAVFSDTPLAQSPTGGKLMTGRGQVFRQLTGATPALDDDLVKNELEKAGINLYSLNSYTEVPQYDNVRNRMLGVVSRVLGMDLIRSQEYRNRDAAGKRKLLEVAYFGKASSDQPKQYRDTLRNLGIKEFKNFRQIANELVKKEYPVLYELYRVKEGFSKGDEADVLASLRNPTPGVIATARNSLNDSGFNTRNMSDEEVMSQIIPDLRYRDERVEDNQDYNQRLLATIDLYRRLKGIGTLSETNILSPFITFGGERVLKESSQ
jgi:hypothetical protein